MLRGAPIPWLDGLDALERDGGIRLNREDHGERRHVAEWLGDRVPEADQIVFEPVKSVWVLAETVDYGRDCLIDGSVATERFHA